MIAAICAALYIRCQRRYVAAPRAAAINMRINWQQIPEVPKRREKKQKNSAPTSSAKFKAPPNFKAPPPKGARAMLRREMSPESQRKFFQLLAAGHFITPGEAYSLVTTAPPSASMHIDIGSFFTANLVAMVITMAAIFVSMCWWRNRKVCVFVDVAVQVDITHMPNIVFTPYGECYHYRNCETITNWRRNATTMLRRPCLYCIPQGVDVEPEAEQ